VPNASTGAAAVANYNFEQQQLSSSVQAMQAQQRSIDEYKTQINNQIRSGKPQGAKAMDQGPQGMP
jgi:hypothetical protein